MRSVCRSATPLSSGGQLVLLPIASAVRQLSGLSDSSCHRIRCGAGATAGARGGAILAEPPYTVSALISSRRWYGATPIVKAAASTPTHSAAGGHATPFARITTAAEAEAVLQRWVTSIPLASTPASSPSSSPGVSPSPPLVLSGKSLVLCVAALQLHDAAASKAAVSTSSSSTSSSSSNVSAPPPADSLAQRYLAACAWHVYTHCNASGKPRAAWQLFQDVEDGKVPADTLRTSVHYLLHKLYGNANGAQGGVGDQAASSPPRQQQQKKSSDYEAQCADRDLELTFEAVEALLAGRQIAETHRAATATKEVGSASTTAAMVPPTQSAAFFIRAVARLTTEPLHGSAEGAVDPATALPSPFLALPPAKQQFWKATAQQLTTVLYLALLVTNTNSTDAQIVKQVFQDAVRTVYGVSATDKFGTVRSTHYMVTVALPFVTRSFSMLLDVVRAQQAHTAQEAKAKAAAAAAQAAPSQHGRADSKPSSTGSGASPKKGATLSSTPTNGKQHTKAKPKDNASGAGADPTAPSSSDSMNKITLLVVCVAALLYVASSNTEVFTGGSQKPSADPQTDEQQLQQTYQRLSSMAASAAAPGVEPLSRRIGA